MPRQKVNTINYHSNDCTFRLRLAAQFITGTMRRRWGLTCAFDESTREMKVAPYRDTALVKKFGWAFAIRRFTTTHDEDVAVMDGLGKVRKSWNSEAMPTRAEEMFNVIATRFKPTHYKVREATEVSHSAMAFHTRTGQNPLNLKGGFAEWRQYSKTWTVRTPDRSAEASQKSLTDANLLTFLDWMAGAFPDAERKEGEMIATRSREDDMLFFLHTRSYWAAEDHTLQHVDRLVKEAADAEQLDIHRALLAHREQCNGVFQEGFKLHQDSK